jgi:hypothetical protein
MPRTIRVHRRPGSSVGVQVACRKSRTLTGGRGCLTIHLAAAGGMFRGRGSTCAAACLLQFAAVRNLSRTQLKSDRMTQNILYIHGAYASPTTFRHMIEHLPDHRAAFADYDLPEELRRGRCPQPQSHGGGKLRRRALQHHRPLSGRCRGSPPRGGRRTSRTDLHHVNAVPW